MLVTCRFPVVPSSVMSDEQDTFDEVFDSMVAVEQSLDEVIESLRGIHFKVRDDQRGIVARWLDEFPIDTEVPIGDRLSLLRVWLEAPWLAR